MRGESLIPSETSGPLGAWAFTGTESHGSSVSGLGKMLTWEGSKLSHIPKNAGQAAVPKNGPVWGDKHHLCSRKYRAGCRPRCRVQPGLPRASTIIRLPPASSMCEAGWEALMKTASSDLEEISVLLGRDP